jgi:hypothetical protein
VAHSIRSGLSSSVRSGAVVAGRISCRVVRVFRLINSSAHIFYRLFLADLDITLKRFNDATRICGHVPRQCLKAASSPTALTSATTQLTRAVALITDLEDVIASAYTGEPIHRALEIYPAPDTRDWLQCLARPVSEWAFSQMVIKMDRRSATAAENFYQMIKGDTSAAALAGRIFETKAHMFFQSILTPRRFTITSVEDRLTTFDIEFTPNTPHFQFGPKQEFMGRLSSSVNNSKSCYLKPLSRTFATFDSFLYQTETSPPGCQPLIGIQVTTASTHPIKVEGLQYLQACLSLKVPALKALRPTTDKKLIILFVVPESMAASWVKMPFQGKVGPWEGKTTQFVLGLPEEEVFKLLR